MAEHHGGVAARPAPLLAAAVAAAAAALAKATLAAVVPLHLLQLQLDHGLAGAAVEGDVEALLSRVRAPALAVHRANSALARHAGRGHLLGPELQLARPLQPHLAHHRGSLVTCHVSRGISGHVSQMQHHCITSLIYSSVSPSVLLHTNA